MSPSPRQRFAALPEELQRQALLLFMENGGDLEALESAWEGWKARPEQLAPDGDWTFWYVEAGRGFGKTELASRWIHQRVDTLIARQNVARGQGGLLHRTSSDVREIMVEGESGLLATAPPGKLPKYEPSKRKVTMWNGYVFLCYSAEEPDALRGPTLTTAWVDEFATHKAITGIDGLTAFDNLRFAMRGILRGDRPRAVLTTTPKRVRAVRTMHTEAALPNSNVVVTRGSLMDNIANLDPSYVAGILRKYAGTALGQQEIDGVLASDVEGSVFKSAVFARTRLAETPVHTMPVVAVDPTSGDGTNDECGIVVCALSVEPIPTEFKHGALTVVKNVRHLYVLDDATISGPPDVWAMRVAETCIKWGTNIAVAEVNQGGKMVGVILRGVNRSLKVKMVHATKGKEVRAEPVAALFAQGRAHLVGEFPELEDQSTTWIPKDREGVGSRFSPDRMDAMVWGATHLLPDVSKENVRHTIPNMKRRVG